MSCRSGEDLPSDSHDRARLGARRNSNRERPLIKLLLVILVVLCIVFALIAIILAVKISNVPQMVPGTIVIPASVTSPDDLPNYESNKDGQHINYLDNGQRVALLDTNDNGNKHQIVMTCGNKACLDLALSLHKTVNKSASPCDNFYNYACGSWPVKDATSANSLLGQVMQSIDAEVQSTLENFLTLPHGQRANGRDIAEQQVVNFYDACTNVTTREKLQGKPLIDLLDSAVSPPFLFGAPSLTNWDAIEAWKRTFRYFGVEVIFSIHVQVPPETEGPVWIVIAPRSPQLGSLVDTREGVERAKEVLRDIGKKLSISAGVQRPFNDPFDYGLSNFVQDTIEFTQYLSTIRRGDFPLQEMTPIEFVQSLKVLTEDEAPFNPVNYFDEFFRNASNSSVTVPINVDSGIKYYIKELARYKNEHRDTWKRRFNNYLTTEIILHYMLEISGDYERHLASFFPKSYNRFYSKSYSVGTRCRNEAEFTFKDIVYEMLANKKYSLNFKFV